MSLHDYRVSRALEHDGVPFFACVMAAMRRADSTNLAKFQRAFPDVWQELEKRYVSPGGLLSSEMDFNEFEGCR